MNFGQALEILKAGGKVARAGWNGKGMWLSLSCDGVREISADKFWSENNADYAASQGGVAKVLPCITMKTATGEILMGWLASQTDVLAEDWDIEANITNQKEVERMTTQSKITGEEIFDDVTDTEEEEEEEEEE